VTVLCIEVAWAELDEDNIIVKEGLGVKLFTIVPEPLCVIKDGDIWDVCDIVFKGDTE
jgi:hypothetical protein